MTLLLLCSTLTSLITQAVKKLLDESGKTYRSNLLAAIVSVLVGTGVGAGYVVVNDIPVDAKVIVALATLILFSWLCAMLGYDKVKQTIGGK